MNKRYFYILLTVFLCAGCKPEANWETDDIQINMTIDKVSAGYVECSFSTNKDAYYMISIVEADDSFNPHTYQKQFMTLALDSANLKYMEWRNSLLRQGEFNIAPFASHSLQYGSVKHFFTGLMPGEKYWVFAFAVNPETLQPLSKLYLEEITTSLESTVDVHFEYRIKGLWDYIYPVDSNGNILSNFPYIATTRDSLWLDYSTDPDDPDDPEWVVYRTFIGWMLDMFLEAEDAIPYYGVQATENDGIGSYVEFEEGHTYYTGICGFDGLFHKATIYKFRWNGEKTEYYFFDTDSANIVNGYDE
ncbi:MAG: hypothetical protein IJS05_02660 [Paludibacteraceae bacterium]|nr:hypothetical protein [Paludibacteraceae bacterium]